MNARWQTFKKNVWDSRSAQERRTLMIAAWILVPLLAYAVLWYPAHTAVNKLRVEIPAMRAQAAHMRVEAEEAAALRHAPQPALLDAAALKTAIEESAARHQLRAAITSLDAQPPHAVRITLDAVSFEQWLAWLRSLQSEQHVRADSLVITALPQTGAVKVSATLVNGGSQ
ncbi:MAG: type II secretion system protein M [Gallionellaceae bacterium]|jgi:general secretion pathway protein M|nr:type II secretion system protein M [Gallionellaceae bacterium]